MHRHGPRLAALAGVLVLCALMPAVAEAGDPLAYVANEQAGTIAQVDLATGLEGKPIKVGSQPEGIAITPDGSTAYVADYGSSQIVPVALATGALGTPIALGDRPNAIAITPNGRTAYVISDSGREWPITLSTRRVGNPTTIPTNSDAIAITPDATTAYITNVADATLSPFTLSNASLSQPINLLAPTPDAVAITPDGSTAWVASNNSGTITPVTLSAGTSGTAIAVGSEPTGIAISADGSTAYVTNFSSGQITPITLATGTLGTPIGVGGEPSAIALVPPGGITTTGGGTGISGTGSSSPPTTLGNQQLTLTIYGSRGSSGTGGGSGAGGGSGTAGTSGGTSGALRSCQARGSRLRVRLTRRILHHGAHLTLRDVIFRLGKRVKRARRLPVSVWIPLRGLRAGRHPLTVRVDYSERVVRARGHGANRHRRTLTVTIHRTLRRRVTVC